MLAVGEIFKSENLQVKSQLLTNLDKVWLYDKTNVSIASRKEQGGSTWYFQKIQKKKIEYLKI